LTAKHDLKTITNRKNMKRTGLLSGILLLGIILSACSSLQGNASSYASIPAGMAYADGKEIYFSHTEISDTAVGEKLTAMMKSPVIVVPSLAKVPGELTAPVYVFQNGKTGKGPLGFQVDVFNNPAGTEGYTPLRKIVFVTWKDGAAARVLTSEAEILESESKGELALQRTEIVVNMPFMVWDGGKR
jgi:hypothetical protein